MITTSNDTAGQAEALERRIKEKGEEAMRLASSGDSKAARRCYVEMAELVGQRSPSQVLQMEQSRGLR